MITRRERTKAQVDEEGQIGWHRDIFSLAANGFA